MITLTIRTDKPEAEIGLYEGGKQLAYESWLAHRQLAETIHLKITELLKEQNKTLINIQGIVIYKGPGSFTGLRIGMSVANALADGLGIPIVGEEGGEWLEKGLEIIQTGANDQMVTPEYGSPPHVTKPKK